MKKSNNVDARSNQRTSPAVDSEGNGAYFSSEITSFSFNIDESLDMSRPTPPVTYENIVLSSSALHRKAINENALRVLPFADIDDADDDFESGWTGDGSLPLSDGSECELFTGSSGSYEDTDESESSMRFFVGLLLVSVWEVEVGTSGVENTSSRSNRFSSCEAGTGDFECVSRCRMNGSGSTSSASSRFEPDASESLSSHSGSSSRGGVEIDDEADDERSRRSGESTDENKAFSATIDELELQR